MGKYMKKAKITGDVTVMEVSSSLGVRTRAKTLALQRLQKTTHQEAPKPDTSYLELRSRRLEKPPLLCESNKRQNPNPKASSRVELGSVNSKSVGSVPPGEKINVVETEDVGVEASYGENVLEFEGRDRSTRESTPFSLIGDPDTIATPGSTTRPTSSTTTSRRVRSNVQGDIPTAAELEEFFAHAEEHAQKEFMDKSYVPPPSVSSDLDGDGPASPRPSMVHPPVSVSATSAAPSAATPARSTHVPIPVPTGLS